jgi:hypothetical protein
LQRVFVAALGFVRNAAEGLSRTEAHDEARNAIKDLMGAYQKVAGKISLKRASTKIAHKMT